MLWVTSYLYTSSIISPGWLRNCWVRGCWISSDDENDSLSVQLNDSLRGHCGYMYLTHLLSRCTEVSIKCCRLHWRRGPVSCEMQPPFMPVCLWMGFLEPHVACLRVGAQARPHAAWIWEGAGAKAPRDREGQAIATQIAAPPNGRVEGFFGTTCNSKASPALSANRAQCSSNRVIRPMTFVPGAISANFFAGRRRDGTAGRLTRYWPWLGLYQCNVNPRDCMSATRALAYSNGVAIGQSLQSPISGTCHEAHEPTKGETLQIHDM